MAVAATTAVIIQAIVAGVIELVKFFGRRAKAKKSQTK